MFKLIKIIVWLRRYFNDPFSRFNRSEGKRKTKKNLWFNCVNVCDAFILIALILHIRLANIPHKKGKQMENYALGIVSFKWQVSTYWLLVRLPLTSVAVHVPSRRQVLVFHYTEPGWCHNDSPMHHSVYWKSQDEEKHYYSINQRRNCLLFDQTEGKKQQCVTNGECDLRLNLELRPQNRMSERKRTITSPYITKKKKKRKSTLTWDP